MLMLITKIFQKLKLVESGRFIYLTTPSDGRRPWFDHTEVKIVRVGRKRLIRINCGLILLLKNFLLKRRQDPI